jgi:acetate---CoA ligase (ADP-forming)
VFGSIERAADVCARLAERGERGPEGVPELPPAGAPVVLDGGDGYTAARTLLAAGGLLFVGARTVTGGAEAAAAARELGYPVVLKALGTLHKSDAGGVALDLRDDASLLAAVADMEQRLAPPGFTVERMAPLADGVELLIGARWDARFGPIALVGLGGLFTEILSDVAVALAPVDEARARALLLSLRAAPLLQGARGRPALDVDAAAAALAALSRVAAQHPELAAIEVNPLLALPDGALGLDARLELAGQVAAR